MIEAEMKFKTTCMVKLLIYSILTMLVLTCMNFFSYATEAEIWWGDPGKVNSILTNFETPNISPGESGRLKVVFSNPFDETIMNISIETQIYRLIFENGDSIWEEIEDKPIILNITSQQSRIIIESMGSHESKMVEWTIFTTTMTRHGDIFSQPIYLVRMKITFYSDDRPIRYASRGYFTDDQWARLQDLTENDTGGVDGYYLKSLGYDGILPETSFIVMEPIPIYPLIFFALIALSSFIIGVYYHLEDKPEEAPKIKSVFTRARKNFLRYLLKFRYSITRRKQ